MCEAQEYADATDGDQVENLAPSVLPEDDEANAAGLPQDPDSIPAFDVDGREDA